tara:strand:- start:896 stop:1042 length:147 start_codon:yes stop_codon:yes gene_type:complete
MDNLSYALFTILLFLIGLVIILRYSKPIMRYTVEKFGVEEEKDKIVTI